ncbi:phosphorylase [Calothrix sp. FACHB-1219]|uniref:5'-methylthioadenosine/S-adenosylhomocysteine nucleosidase family protein n=1 Tax=unclassified Calothrix TaxID=2619626 RepID=UPI001682601F|nr:MULTISPECIES: phosphorylase [unclassified Calothrix]MBD2206231.1 phosphorylase [Calothrix sp. FACHB-168]MBD2219127.1 phosphorylase [Calothrix sp. FACHB-1219]
MPNAPLILVPQGAEYQAVCRGLNRVTITKPNIIPIPVGIKPLTTYLHKLQADGIFSNQPQLRILLMGLCGSLSPNYPVGKIVLYENCIYQGKVQECDAYGNPFGERAFTVQMRSQLNSQLTLVKGLTSDRVICSATEKRQLGETLGADVVDMEGFAALEFFNSLGVAVAILRVVSDDCHHDIPDLTSAISPDGSLRPLPLAMTFIKQPIAAIRLIRGSLQGLKVLEEVSKKILIPHLPEITPTG